MEWRGSAFRVAAMSHLVRRRDRAPAVGRKANVQRSVLIERWTFGFEKLAAAYSPTPSQGQYHRR